MVEVFKTNVSDLQLAEDLLEHLKSCFPQTKINFALDDCDRILRMEAGYVDPEKVEELMTRLGYLCQALE